MFLFILRIFQFISGMGAAESRSRFQAAVEQLANDKPPQVIITSIVIFAMITIIIMIMSIIILNTLALDHADQLKSQAGELAVWDQLGQESLSSVQVNIIISNYR